MSDDLLTGIRDRRRVDVDEALALLDAAASVSASIRCSLLSMASRSLADPVVLERWVRLAASEGSAEIKQDMVSRLGNVDHSQITDVPAYIALMASSVVDPYLRPVALGALSRLAVAYPGAVDALEQAYAGQPSATARRQILIGLCQLYRLPPGLADFLAAEVDNCDADVKVLAVDRLLRHNAPNAAMLAHWLEPIQPSGVKERVLQHLVDRSLAMGQEVAEVLRTEGEASVRLLAVRALTAQSAGAPGPVQALLDAVRSDPDDDVRAEAVKAFQHAIEPTPEILRSLLASLNAEKSETVARLVLSSLTPFVRSSTEVRDALLDLVDQNLRPDMAATVVEMLGQVLRWDAALLPIFLDRYRSSGNDHVRSLLLEAMARYTDTDERLVELYTDAIATPDARTRNGGWSGC
jgi:hypothetical protein